MCILRRQPRHPETSVMLTRATNGPLRLFLLPAELLGHVPHAAALCERDAHVRVTGIQQVAVVVGLTARCVGLAHHRLVNDHYGVLLAQARRRADVLSDSM